MSKYEIRRLAQELARQGRIVDDLATKPQLAYSSIEAGAVRSYDEHGNLRLVVGEQGDGTQSITVVDGPPPASPSRPSVSVDGPIITTVWDGELAGVDELPKDFQHIEVHVTPVPGDGSLAGVASIEGRDGGQATAAVAQSGTYEVSLLAVSQAGKRSVPSEAVTVEVTLVDIDGALKLVKESADGKNRLTWDPAQPPAQYEGAAGDTWFQTSDDGIVAQYRWTGAVWESQTLTHEVIASIDLGKATVGELDGGRIEANTIRAEHLTAGAIDGKVITGATVQTARSGRRVVMSEQGVSAFDDSGAEQVRIRAGESFFRGDLEADSFTSRGQARFEGEATLAPNATLRLDGGVQAPVNPPQLTPYWKQFVVDIETGAGSGDEAYGVAYHPGTEYWFTTATTRDEIEHNRIIKFKQGRQTPVAEYKLKDGLWSDGGIAVVGDRLYVLGQKRPNHNHQYWVQVYTLNGAYVTEWEYAQVGWSKTNKLGYKPGIGPTDDGNLVIAHCYDTGQMMYRHYSVDGRLLSEHPAPKTDKTLSNIAGAVSGVYDRNTSAPACTIAKVSKNAMETFGRDGEWQSDETFPAPPGEQLAGLCVGPNNRFYSIGRRGVVTEYMPAGTGGDDWWVSWAYQKSTYTTEVTEPHRIVEWPARSQLRGSYRLSDMPEPGGIYVPYLAKGSSAPALSEFRGAAYVDVLGLVVRSTILPGQVIQQRPAPTRNTFPQSGNALLEASSNLFQVRSDGSGRWGPLTFTSTGEVKGLPDVPKVARGKVDLGTFSRDESKTRTVTFPTGVFTKTPTVALNSFHGWIIVKVRNTTTTKFDLHSWTIPGKEVNIGTVEWLAVGE